MYVKKHNEGTRSYIAQKHAQLHRHNNYFSLIPLYKCAPAQLGSVGEDQFPLV